MSNIKDIVAILETKVDVLESELHRLNDMLIRVGFTEGIETLKSTIAELLSST